VESFLFSIFESTTGFITEDINSPWCIYM